MKIEDFNNKVMYVKNEDKYYYFPWVDTSERRTFYGSWDEGELPKYPTNGEKSMLESWQGFILQQPEGNLIKYKVSDFNKECEIIQIHLIKSLFTGWLL